MLYNVIHPGYTMERKIKSFDAPAALATPILRFPIQEIPIAESKLFSSNSSLLLCSDSSHILVDKLLGVQNFCAQNAPAALAMKWCSLSLLLCLPLPRCH
jgi:hypothetical protein